VSSCAGRAALYCVSVILNVCTRRNWCTVHPKGPPCWGKDCSYLQRQFSCPPNSCVL